MIDRLIQDDELQPVIGLIIKNLLTWDRTEREAKYREHIDQWMRELRGQSTQLGDVHRLAITSGLSDADAKVLLLQNYHSVARVSQDKIERFKTQVNRRDDFSYRIVLMLAHANSNGC